MGCSKATCSCALFLPSSSSSQPAESNGGAEMKLGAPEAGAAWQLRGELFTPVELYAGRHGDGPGDHERGVGGGGSGLYGRQCLRVCKNNAKRADKAAEQALKFCV